MEATEPVQVSRRLIAVQAMMGFCAWLLLWLPYGRRIYGVEKLDTRKRYLFVCNHISLLDTILLGALFWRSKNYPIMVLGDKHVWSVTWLHRMLSRPIGFLLERGKLNPGRIRELQKYGQLADRFNLVVFPEGTRGNGVDVAECQPGIYHVAQEARVPIVPIFIENMQFLSTKTGRFHPIAGLRRIDTHFGAPIAPEDYLSLSREEFTEFIRRKITATRPTQPAVSLNPAPLRGSP